GGNLQARARTAAAQPEPAKDRHVMPETNRLATAGTGRTARHHRDAARPAVLQAVDETAQRSPQQEEPGASQSFERALLHDERPMRLDRREMPLWGLGGKMDQWFEEEEGSQQQQHCTANQQDGEADLLCRATHPAPS